MELSARSYAFQIKCAAAKSEAEIKKIF